MQAAPNSASFEKYKVLVAGCGSIGRRHLTNLKALGVKSLAGCDPDAERAREISAELGVPIFSDYSAALRKLKPDAVLVCTPPVFHLSQALQAMRAGAHLMIEKPLADRLEGTDALATEARDQHRKVQIAYNLRFHPGLLKLRDLIQTGELGRVFWVRAEAGQYLPDWRPSQDYRQSYTARRDLGGGILLDGSHEIDYLMWLLGKPVDVFCRSGKVSALEVDVEDSASMFLRFPGGAQAELHLDFVQRTYSRTCKVIGELGTALWDFSALELRWFLAKNEEWQSFPYSFEANDMYVAEVRHFLESLETGEAPLVSLAQGQDVVRVVEAAKASAAMGQTHTLEWSAKSSAGSVLAIVQARMGSSRLPGKSLFEVEGKAMLWHVVNRVRLAQRVDRVMVATSTQPADDAIEKFCRENSIACSRGSEHDVLDRFYQAGRSDGASTIVRITADCPLVDPEVVDRVVARYQQGGVDYVSNAMVRTYPDGLDTEAFSFTALEEAWREARKPSEREHVTPFLRSGKFRTANVECDLPALHDHHRWTVDETDDIEFVRAVYREFRGKNRFGLREVLRVLAEKPALGKINGAILSNQGYLRSLYRESVAGPAPSLTLEKSKAWAERAAKVVPGGSQTFSKGTNQHVRGVAPMLLLRGQGCHVWDVDGNQYIDYIQGLLPNILGYAHGGVNAAVTRQLEQGVSFSLPHPLEVELAERLTRIIPCAEMVRFGKNGSDATSGAVRAARAFSGRERIACCGYHGWQDWYIGSTARHAGVPGAVRELTHPFAYNDLAALEKVLEQHTGEFAAVILEPVNFFPPAQGYLAGVKDLAHRHGAVLIFDEICTGFHFGLGGAQKFYGVTPDMACFGKAMGNGFPIACIVGRADLMKTFEEIFFSFTFGGDVASMAASMAVLDILESTDALARMEALGRVLQDGFNLLAREAGLESRLKCIGYPFWSLIRFLDAEGKDSLLVRSLFSQECVKRGVLSLVTHNMTAAHDGLAVEKTLQVYAAVFKTLAGWLSDAKPELFLEGDIIQPVFRVR